ncbi:MAG: quinolinate synthase NadA [Candidatus Bathyarchaeia archaeon]
MDPQSLPEKISSLKREKKAIILAHNYQREEVQDLADYVGDSVELSRRAMEEKDARIILFSAVDFMAETAAILNPDKKVLLPSLGARCPMAQMLPLETLKTWKARYPGVPTVLYVNTLAEAKAECDVTCTSANALQVVKNLDADTVLFGPDRNLAEYVKRRVEKTIIPIPERGFCPTHQLFLKEDIRLAKELDPSAVVMVHPECTPDVQEIADFIGSTSQMCRYAATCRAKSFIVATEVGLLHRLRKENPEKTFLPAYDAALCPNMKRNTLELIYRSLLEEEYAITIPRAVAEKARKAIQRMFELTNAK